MWSSKYSNRIIAVSNSVRNHWIKYVNENKIERIYNGIVFEKNQFIKKIKKEKNDYIITSVSRLIPYKGHNYLIDIAIGIGAKYVNDQNMHQMCKYYEI